MLGSEAAQQIAPQSRIVYVDNDPVVLAHARALLVSQREGYTGSIDAGLRDTGKILRHAAAALDPTQPAARAADRHFALHRGPAIPGVSWRT